MFVLVDCNSFYASCERVFRPDLRGKAVAVLSNNDGCIVARSAEAKALNMPMGIPYFKMKSLIAQQGVTVFSSNYGLYGDLSQRVMRTLARFAPHMEVYSIDEAFLDLRGYDRYDLTRYGRRIRDMVGKWTGIPVSVGIGETKTLAKIANKVAKKSPTAGGVLDLSALPNRELALSAVRVEDVWGVGHRWAKKLRAQGIHTALALSRAEDGWIRREMGVVGLRTVWELRGTSCIPLNEAPPPKQGISSSRSFGRPVETQSELEEALVTYVSRAAEKLRAQDSVTGLLTIYITTGRFGEGPHYTNSESQELLTPTSDTLKLARLVRSSLKRIYRKGFRYKKAGVLLDAIQPRTGRTPSLLDQEEETPDRLLQVMDSLNRNMGQGTVQLAGAGLDPAWEMRRSLRSPRYTTSWDELPRVRANI